MQTLRVGAVTYLNTKPLVYRLADRCSGISLEYDLPSRLADRLAADDLDVGLIPVAACFDHPEYVLVSDACIACRGPVRSVRLLSRVPIAEIRTLALDEGSRTSALLAQILLCREGVTPRLRPLPLGVPPEEMTCDAFVVIGDRAMHVRDAQYHTDWDLGECWFQWTGTPFVFALWMARPQCDVLAWERAFSTARDEGLAHAREIAANEAPRVGLSPEEVHVYLTQHLHFRLGPKERHGLHLFYQHAVGQGLAPAGWKLRIHDCQQEASR